MLSSPPERLRFVRDLLMARSSVLPLCLLTVAAVVGALFLALPHSFENLFLLSTGVAAPASSSSLVIRMGVFFFVVRIGDQEKEKKRKERGIKRSGGMMTRGSIFTGFALLLLLLILGAERI